MAQIDYIGIRTNSNIHRKRMEHQQRMLKKSREKKRANQQRTATVQVNGKPLQSSVTALERNGTTFVPMRDIFQALGANVTYNNEARLITAERGSSTLQLPLSGDKARVNQTTMSLTPSQKPFVYRGVTMVPLRLVAEGMGAEITRVPSKTGSLIQIRR
jgi:hypothetical protein